MKEYVSGMFKKLAELSSASLIALALLVVFGVLLLTLSGKVKWNARMLAMGAICIALSFVLSFVRLYRMPQGGSITLCSMLPVMMFAFAYGIGPGLVCGLAYSFLQLFQDLYFVNVLQLLLDYTLAYTALGLAGLFSGKEKGWAFPAGILVAVVVRMFMHILSGVIFFAEYAEGSGHGPVVYSILYSLTSVGLDGLICAVIAAIPGMRRLLGRIARSA